MRGCYDSVSVYSDCYADEPAWQECGSRQPEVISSGSDCVGIGFKTDDNLGFRGFKVKVTAVNLEETQPKVLEEEMQ